MKNIGYLIITIGFLAGALVSVLDEQIVNWNYFLPALIVGIVGIIFVRDTTKRQAQAEGKLSINIQNIETSLKRIVDNMQKMDEEKSSMNPYDARHRIDELFLDDLNTFVEARESISHVYGMQNYANVMSDFAAGERYLNRVWTASADGYIDEVQMYIERAHAQFKEALQKLQQLKMPKPVS